MRLQKQKARLAAAIMAAVLLLPALVSAFAAAYPYETMSMDDVNLRKYANMSSVVLKKIKAGDVVTILGKKGDYYQVTFDGATGYAIKKYIDGTDPSPDPTPDANMRLSAPPAVTGYPYDTTTAGRVKLRKTASETGAVIRTLIAGESLTVYGVDKGFAKVKYASTTGYVLAGYLNLANIPTPTPVPTPTLSPEAAKYTPLKNGDSGEAVTALQNALAELDYLDDKVDGKFGKNTEEALKLMQKRNGLEQTGVADQGLQWLMYEGTPKDKRGYRQYVKTVAPVPGAIIRQDSKGEAVKTLQNRLTSLGYYAGEISGVCDKATVAAIKRFEEKHALTQDGVMSASDQTLLYGVNAMNAAVVVTPTPTPTPQPPKGTVRKNDKGNDVKLVQQRLKELGYYTGKISGTFGETSVTALEKFQKANGLTADGVCGIQTSAVLFAAHPVYAIPTAMPITTISASVSTIAPLVTYPPITQENAVIIKAGARGEEVLRMQLRLQELGYYTSRQDGVCLTDDINAVRAFQSASGLKVDGKAGFNTQTMLYSDAAVRGNAAATSAAATQAVLRYGSEGAEVVNLQNRLITLGYLASTADGKFGAATRAALIAFQKASNLTRDGVAGTKTMEALNSSSAADSKLAYTTLRVGAVSQAVSDLQNRLITLGYLSGKADGKFGVQTSLALIAFQKANNLTADGIAGASTIKKLNDTAVVTAAGSQTSTVTPTAPTIAAGTVSAASVRYANWYTEVRAKVRKLPNVTVYDFSTGISWQLNIFSTGAHADAEPITATDTANMNRAFGATTWTPKAVWVVLSDGTVYMASTHNTPHETYHVRNNNFDGHLCVHFPRTEAQVTAIGPYATQHQKAIDLGWAATLRRAGQ